MRVIGGEFRSRVIKSLPGMDVRPTPDRLRETLFNVLAPIIEGTIFADIYAGTGAVGIEALSRGAKRAIFVEPNREAASVIRENLRSLDVMARAELRVTRASIALPQIEADIVFLDPPYRLEQEYERCLTFLGERPPRLTIAQHASRLQLQDRYGKLKRTRVLKQGDNSLSFFEMPAPRPPGEVPASEPPDVIAGELSDEVAGEVTDHLTGEIAGQPAAPESATD